MSQSHTWLAAAHGHCTEHFSHQRASLGSTAAVSALPGPRLPPTPCPQSPIPAMAIVCPGNKGLRVKCQGHGPLDAEPKSSQSANPFLTLMGRWGITCQGVRLTHEEPRPQKGSRCSHGCSGVDRGTRAWTQLRLVASSAEGWATRIPGGHPPPSCLQPERLWVSPEHAPAPTCRLAPG